ncbi:MAG: hypothetical protein IKQ06_04690 [Bacilli bacterium]|nr:hypothetical protein [Bacilli bacterium]MBR6137435.1 hypothetical protein [Bacilli bacterium]
MIRKKKIVITSLVVAIVMLLSISIAYAALSTTLTITMNQITQNAMTWDIGFQTGTVTGVVTTTNNLASCGTATATSTTISGISTTLSDVGDRCAYTFTVKNNGTIGGKIASISVTQPSGQSCSVNGSTMVCGDITYKLHYDSATSTSLVAVGNTIAPKSGSTPTTKTIVLTIENTGSAAPTADYNQSGFAYTIKYGQN